MSTASPTASPTASGTLTKASGTGDATLTFSAFTNYAVYATPSTTTNANLTKDITSAVSIGSGIVVWFNTTGPYAATPTAAITSSGYSQYLPTQLQTTTSAAAGDTAQASMTMQYNEN
jgi:hypothetical protein